MPEASRARTKTGRDMKEDRLQLRMTPDLKRQLAEVAHYRGLSMSDFATHAISDAVTKARYQHQVIELSREESAWLAGLLMNPPDPNERMAAAAERYTQLIRP